MAGICTCVPMIRQLESRGDESYNICRSDDLNTLENYTLIPVERAGFVIIKQVISLGEEGC